MAAAAKAARRNTTVHMNEFYVPNDPFQDPCIGRRTGVPLKIQARKDSLGFDNIDDYFPDSDPEEENIVPNVQSSDKDFVGRRTGMSFNINPRKDSKGFDNVDDYFPDSGAGKSEESSPIEGQAADPTAQDDQVEAKSPEENTCDETDELQTADTPEGTPVGESPNDTGTLIKHVSSHQASPRVEGPIKKRLSFSHGKTPAEPELDKQRMTRGPQDRKDTKAINEEDGNNDSEIIVVDIGDDTQPEHEGASTSHLPTAIKTKEKVGKQKMTNAKQTKNHRNMTDDDEEVIDIEGIDGEETFLTIGNTTQVAKSIVVDKSSIDVEAERFVMSESFVLEGTRHKTMSPEYVSCSDSQPELHDPPATKGKKSKIPVRKNGMTMSAKPKATRGRPKKVEKSGKEELTAGEALYNEEGDSEGDNEVGEGDGDGDDEVEGGSSNSKQEQSKSLRGRKQNTKQRLRATRGGQKKVEESKIKEAEEDLGNDNGEDEGDEGMSSSNSKQEQSKSLRSTKQNTKQRATRGHQKKVEESKIKEAEEDLCNDNGEDEGDEGMSSSNSNQEQSKSLRRRRQNAKHRASPGGQKNVEESEIEEPEAGEDLGNDSGEDESDERMRKSSRGHKQKIEEAKLVESEAVEVNDGDAKKKEKRRAKGLPGTKQQQKSTRKAKLVAVASDEELCHGGGNKSDDIDDDQEQKGGKGRRSVPNIKQQQKRMPRGRKQKSNENKDGEVNEGDNREADVDEEKPAGPKSRTKKVVEDSKKQKQAKRKDVTKIRDQAKEAELSGRKTRAQRRKEADVKINRKDGNGEEEGKIEVGVVDVDVDVEDVENENVASEETGQEEEDELGGRKTRAQRKKEADAKINRKDGNGEEEGKIEVGVVDSDVEDVVENENLASEETGQEEGDQSELGGRKTRVQRKKEAVTKLDKKDGNGEKGDEEVGVMDSDVEDVAEDENVASEETGQEEEDKAELGGRKTRVQRKKQAVTKLDKKDGSGEEEGEEVGVVDSDVVENENVASEETGQEEGDQSELGGRKTRAQRKKQAVTKLDKKDGSGEKGDEEVGVVDSDVEDVAEDENVASEDTGQEKEESEGDDTVVENNSAQELNNVQTSTNKSGQESVSNISNISSNASSSSESKKKNGSGGGTKRRKRTSILPPYAAKRRGNKANSLKTSVTVNSHDNTTESEPTIEAKKPRLDETLTKKGDRKGGRAARTGRKSGGQNKSVKERNNGIRGKSSSVMQNDDEGEDVTASGEVHEVFEEGDGNYSVEEAGGVEGRSFEEVPSENMSPTPIPRPTKTATSLKSILKSGGSVGRATAVSRKRQINTDKSHSGGSDADDESVLPAKQPNRQRLSTVSFASNPFGRASPQDLTPSMASKHSPVGSLSFVSKDSSYRFTDGTFTPGSAQTVRSSVGSASGASSSDDTVIVPEEEVSITNDTKQLGDTSDEHSTRRSKRTIVPPLQFWKNERIDYERRKSGGWCVKGVIKNPTPTPKLRRKSKKDKKPVVKKEKHVNAADSSEEELDNFPQEELDGFKEVTNPTGIVLNPENNEEVHMDIFHVPGMLNFTNPSGKPSTDDDPLVVHKFISQPFFGGGQVILKPGAEKGRQFVRNDTMVFYVIKGRIMVTVHQSSVVLGTGATFFVPQGNSYNIKNLKQTDSKLMFVQIKG